jgi:hypothetical protein
MFRRRISVKQLLFSSSSTSSQGTFVTTNDAEMIFFFKQQQQQQQQQQVVTIETPRAPLPAQTQQQQHAGELHSHVARHTIMWVLLLRHVVSSR